MSTVSPATTCLDVLTFPVRAPINVLLWLAEKVKQLYVHCMGFFLGIGVFMFGEYHKGFWQREIIEFFKVSPCDTAERKRFDPARLEESVQILKDLGGCVSYVWPKDGGAKIEYMLLRYEKVKEKINEKGGQWVEVPIKETKDGYVYDKEGKLKIEIINSPTNSEAWKKHYNNVLKRIGWDEVTFTDEQGKTQKVIMTAKWTDDKRVDPEALYISCHSPTVSWGMDRWYAAHHLALHGSVCLFDYRGTWNSTGKASEGGYYLDARAVFDQMMKCGYKAGKTVASGFCLGAAVAADLKRYCPDVIFNPINAFDSLERTVGNQVFPFGWLGNTALSSIMDKSLHVKQDCFDTAGKLRRMQTLPLRGYTLQVSTVTDTIIAGDGATPGGAIENIRIAAEKAGRTIQLLFNPPKKKGNGHSIDPLRNAAFRQLYIEVLTNIIPLEGLC